MTIAGLISSLMFANRSSFCMPFYIAIILLIYYSLLKYKTSRILSIKLVSIILLVLLFGYIFFSTDLSFLNLYEAPILKRFGENNLGNARFKLWGLGLQHLTTDLWGGKPYPLIIDTLKLSRLNPLFLNDNFLTPNYYQQFYPISFEFPFIHNLWLDIHHQAGIIPFCFLIIFQLTHLKSLLSLILNNDSIVSLTCLCLGSAFIFYFLSYGTLTTINLLPSILCVLICSSTLGSFAGRDKGNLFSRW